MAFPASIWEQDEAYFGCGVLRFEPLANHPHPPWFPLWIGIGKLLNVLVGEPTLALQIASLAASVWVLFPVGFTLESLAAAGFGRGVRACFYVCSWNVVLERAGIQ